MSHLRKRHLSPIVSKLLTFSPIIGILGHRQVGKTTLLETLAHHYHTMDSSADLIKAETGPEQYLEEIAGAKVAIDECQLAPALFPALKEWVRKHRKPGQFLLSGSVRFTSRKAIQESLTGRIINLELLPMLLSELGGKELPTFWRQAIDLEEFNESYAKSLRARHKPDSLMNYFERGGLPGVCFIRDSSFRQKKMDSQLETILDRDVRKVVSTNIPYPQLRQLLTVVGNRQGEPAHWSALKNETEISVPTLKKLMYCLENVFLLRSILVEGDVKGPVHYFEDQGELFFVRTKSQTVSERVIHLLMIHIRGEFSYGSTTPFRIFQYRTRAGVCVPLVIQVKQDFLGVIATQGDIPNRVEMAAADSLLKRFGRSKAVFVHGGTHTEVINQRKILVPVRATV